VPRPIRTRARVRGAPRSSEPRHLRSVSPFGERPFEVCVAAVRCRALHTVGRFFPAAGSADAQWCHSAVESLVRTNAVDTMFQAMARGSIAVRPNLAALRPFRLARRSFFQERLHAAYALGKLGPLLKLYACLHPPAGWSTDLRLACLPLACRLRAHVGVEYVVSPFADISMSSVTVCAVALRSCRSC
jgi:hypothetical protein